MLQDFIIRWGLTPVGEPIGTATSALLPVTWRGHPAMLKVALIEEERRGAELMEVWSGEGAAPVFARDGGALLMERSVGGKSLAAMSASGGDDDATRII